MIPCLIEIEPQAQTRIWMDLWFNKMNASSVHGGRVNAYYNAMKKNAVWWWGDWNPYIGNSTESLYFGPNLDYDGNLIHSQDLELVKINFNLSRPETNTYNDADFRLVLQDFQTLEYKQELEGQVDGVDTPLVVPTLVPDMPSTGFWTPIYQALARLGDVFTTALSAAASWIWAQIGARWPWFTSFWDNVGLTVSTLFDYMTEIWGYFLGLITFAGNLLDPIRKVIDVFTTAYSYVQTMFGWIGGADLANLIIIMIIVMYFIPLMYAFQVGDIQSIKDLVVAPLRFAFGAMMWGFEMIKSLITWALEAIPL